MAKNSEIIDEFIVTLNDNNSVSVSRIYKSTMAALKEIAEANGIEVQKTWTTQHLGRLLCLFLIWVDCFEGIKLIKVDWVTIIPYRG